MTCARQMTDEIWLKLQLDLLQERSNSVNKDSQ